MSQKQLSPLFTWRSAICESGLEPTTRLVAFAVSLHMNERGGSAFPGARLVAADTGLSESTVRAHLHKLVDGGWLVLVEAGGRRGERRKANAYQASVPLREPEGSVRTTPTVAGGEPLRETAPTPPGAGGQDVIEGAIEDVAPTLSPLPGIEDARAAGPRVSKPRARDPIFDALVEAWGARPPALFGKIKRELIETYGDEVRAEEILRRSHEAQARYDDVTPYVLVTRWPDLVPKGRKDATGRDRAPGDWDGETQTTVREKPRA